MDSHPQGVSLCRTQHPGIPWKLRFREIGPLLGSLTHPLPTTLRKTQLSLPTTQFATQLGISHLRSLLALFLAPTRGPS